MCAGVMLLAGIAYLNPQGHDHRATGPSLKLAAARDSTPGAGHFRAARLPSVSTPTFRLLRGKRRAAAPCIREELRVGGLHHLERISNFRKVRPGGGDVELVFA